MSTRCRRLSTTRVIFAILLAAIVVVFAVAARRPTDPDIRRYYAYANATLGRGYDAFYIRTGEAWERAFVTGERSELDEYARTDGVLKVGPAQPLLPYRDFFVEYPPGFFLAVLPPALMARSLAQYKWLFQAWMAVCLAGAVLMCGCIARELNASEGRGIHHLALWTVIAAFALGKVTLQRYDALISLLICTMCWATLRGRPRLLGVATGVAVTAKLVPGFGFLVCGLYLLHTKRARELATAAVTSAATGLVVCAPAFAGGGAGLLDVLRYAANRPLEYESTAAAVLGLWSAVDRSSAAITYAYGSTNVVGDYAAQALAAATGAGVIALVIVYAWTWIALQASTLAQQPRVLVAGMLVSMALLTVFAKVSSVQYLIWLMPLGLLDGLSHPPRFRLLLLCGALVLAQIGYPLASAAVERLEPWAFAVVLLRQVTVLLWSVQVMRDAIQTTDTSTSGDYSVVRPGPTLTRRKFVRWPGGNACQRRIMSISARSFSRRRAASWARRPGGFLKGLLQNRDTARSLGRRAARLLLMMSSSDATHIAWPPTSIMLARSRTP